MARQTNGLRAFLSTAVLMATVGTAAAEMDILSLDGELMFNANGTEVRHQAQPTSEMQEIGDCWYRTCIRSYQQTEITDEAIRIYCRTNISNPMFGPPAGSHHARSDCVVTFSLDAPTNVMVEGLMTGYWNTRHAGQRNVGWLEYHLTGSNGAVDSLWYDVVDTDHPDHVVLADSDTSHVSLPIAFTGTLPAGSYTFAVTTDEQLANVGLVGSGGGGGHVDVTLTFGETQPVSLCERNGDGEATIEDLLDFLGDFLAGSPGADLVAPTGVVEIRDLLAFIDCWFSAGAGL